MKRAQDELESTLTAKKQQQAKLEEERNKYQNLWMLEEGVSARLRQEVHAFANNLLFEYVRFWLFCRLRYDIYVLTFML